MTTPNDDNERTGTTDRSSSDPDWASADKRQEVVNALWEFLYQQATRPHNCRSRGLGANPNAIEVSANLSAVSDAADDIMELFGYDRNKIPMCDD